MYFNVNVYRGRKMFNLNFEAGTAKQAIADAAKLIPDFKQLRWVLWSCPPRGRKWTKGPENTPQSRPKSRTKA